MKLSDICEINMGQSPKSEYYNAVGEGLPFLQGNRTFGLKYPTFDTYTTFVTKTAEAKDVIMSVRAPVGDINITPVKICLGRGVCGLRHKEGEQQFIYYLMRYYSKSLINNESGTIFGSVNHADIANLEVDVPSLSEQKAIAEVLSSLDDKIDLLHRQNKTLEAMAEALFRQWFVEKESDDFNQTKIDDIVTIKGGTTPSTTISEYWDGDVHWTTPRDLSNHNSVYLLNTERKITEKGLAQIGSGLLPVGSVLLSSRAPIGYLAITDIPVAINQGYIGIVCDKYISNYFIYLWCKANMELIENSGNGSVFQEIAKSTFRSIIVTIPENKTCDEFQKTVEPLFIKIKNNQYQIRTLEKLRDTLLPKLMSGEVSVAG
jgi:type I restriction enzyme S subunit